ncbi:MAG: ATP-binding cassette domain-containing protein, partial [Gammaproteobacteria bacterium]
MGIVGHNGAGKSTLLRIITGITEADSGSVRVNGAIAPVLALQGGFNPQSTGRDNVYLRGAAMGLSRAEIDERFDSIGAFADIGDAMAQPLRTYSNGMRARLAFAVAFNAQPDILIVDETLTVGDEIFRRKCMDRIITIKESGATILFVTHGYNLVLQLCDRAVLLDQGERLLVSDPKTVVERFHELVYAQPEERTLVRKDIKEQDLNGIDAQLRRYDGKSVSHAGDIQKDDFSDANLISKTRRELVKQGAVIKEVRLFDFKGEAVNTLKSKADYGINVPIWLTEPANKVRVTIAIKTIEGIIVSEQVFTFCGTGDNETLRPKTQL